MSGRFYLLFFLILNLPVKIKAQATGSPILNVTFGQGFSAPGPPLPSINTSINYSPDSCPPRGYYTVTNNFYNCPAFRTGRALDHTTQDNPFTTMPGYAMIVNDTASRGSRILYIDTLNATLCPGQSYQFSAWLINMEIPAACNKGHYPSFTFNVETPSGQILQSGFTGPMGYDYNVTTAPPAPKFHFFGISFVMPNNVNGLVLKIFDESPGYAPCGYQYAIDDIQLAPYGPKIKMSFADGNELVKAVCFEDNKTISFTGSMDAFYANPSLQWQSSKDSGVNWVDIPGAIKDSLSVTFSTPDTFLIRLTGSDASTIANPNCRVASNYVIVVVNGPPSGYTINNNSPVCSGKDIKFSVAGNEASYIWTGPNGFYDNSAYPHIAQSVLADSGTYYVQIFSQGGCEKTDSTRIAVIGTDVVVMPNVTNICAGKPIQLHASDGIKYEWSPSLGLSSTNVQNPVATPDKTTRYLVTVFDQSGCSDSAGALVMVKNKIPVKAGINATNFVCFPYDTITITNNSEGNIATSLWNFGNGFTSTSYNPPTQMYLVNSNTSGYTIRLVVTDSSGCSDTAYHKLTPENNCYIAVPNAFTPNGDGLNDYLYPLNAYKATDLAFRVFNRLGQLVFQTNDWTKKWDGSIKGDPQPVGIYVWTLSYTDPSNKKILLKGSTLLLR